MKAMILAAGRGERMRPLTDFTPKPLLKVGDKPLIVWHLERLAQAGFKEIVINHAHLGEQIEQALGNGAEWGLNIQYSPEKIALETAGGIANALHLLGSEPFLVVNGDTFTEIDFQQVANHFKSAALQPQGLSPQNISAKADYSCLQANIHAGAGHALKLAHLVLVDNPPQHPNGDFAIEFKSKSGGMLKNEGAQMRTFSGVGVYHPDLFADVTKGQPAKLAPLLRKAIENNAATAHHYQGVWHDIGTPERLIKLDDSLLRV
jgi:MurNAc alpha-1-phosphate uridylyltransferase